MRHSNLTCLGPLTHLLARQNVGEPDQTEPELFPNDNGTNILEGLGLSELPHPDSNVTLWEPGRIPQACVEISTDVAGQCDVTQMEVYDVVYEDCREPWVICRCPDADENVDRLVQDLGQLPVRARSVVRYVVMSDHEYINGQSALEGQSIYWQGDLIIYGNWSSVGLFVHEATHNMDWWIAGGGDHMYSETREWETIFDNDTCVADWYSKAAYPEAYAQAAVLVAFDLNSSGPLDDVVDFDCMAGAYETIDEQLGEYLTYDAEATCTQRFPMGRIVCLQDDGDFAYCDEEEDEEEEEQEEEEEEEEDNGDDSTGEDNNDDTNNTDEDSNDDDEGRNNNEDNENGDNDGNDGNDDGDDSSPPNEESSAVRVISMGPLPMLIFKPMAQVIKAVGLRSSR